MCGRFVLFTSDESLLDAVGTLPGVTEVHAPEGTPPLNEIALMTPDLQVVTDDKDAAVTLFQNAMQ